MAPISATYQRIFMVISRMKKPSIIIITRLAGAGRPKPITVLIQRKSAPEG